MELTKQVCSLELAKRLKELRVKQQSVFAHYDGRVVAHNFEHTVREFGGAAYAAFTVAELGEMVPRKFYTRFDGQGWIGEVDGKFVLGTASDTEADARAKMLIYLLEHHILPDMLSL